MENRILRIVKLGDKPYAIRETEKKDRFICYPMPNGNTYELTIHDGRINCTCPGYSYRGQCKHVAAIAELVDEGAVIATPPAQTEGRINRALVEPLVSEIFSKFRSHNVMANMAGSYRRGLPTVHDLDIVAVGKTDFLLELFQYFEPDATDVQGVSIVRFSIPLSSERHIKVDLNTTEDEDDFGALLLFLTGSKEFNIQMRQRAKELELKLNRHGLWDKENCIASKTEAAIFEALGMDYILPKDRS